MEPWDCPFPSMNGDLRSAESTGGHADLRGSGWGLWSGNWSACRRLEGRQGRWLLVDGNVTLEIWQSLGRAIDAIWKARKVADGSPWAIGWLGYQACAQLGGDLPARSDSCSELDGMFLLEPQRQDSSVPLQSGHPCPDSMVYSSLNEESFKDEVRRIRALIAAGSVYQVNLCRRFTVEQWEGGLRQLFETASVGSASPDYLSGFSWGGSSSGELVCASMELLISRRGGFLETRPIKGTRPRGKTVEDDLDMIRQLESDDKERAELAMIVDLERNDLGRVARTGSVAVDDPGLVRTWERIHHRVARVTAEVPEATPWWEVLAAMAPGGSVTGCPKEAAMAVIADMEPVVRGPFTGALGVIAGNGDMELALPIRTVWTSGDRLEMGAGCGIVWESDPEAEEAESRLKVQKWLELMGGKA